MHETTAAVRKQGLSSYTPPASAQCIITSIAPLPVLAASAAINTYLA